MTSTPKPAASRRRLSFGLRTLLAVVTLAAVASWGYWFGWPWWQMHQQQTRLINSVANLKAGLLESELNGAS